MPVSAKKIEQFQGGRISLSGLTHSYRRSSQATLQGIDLEIEPGEAVAIVGRSGSGKSTLLHIAAGLLPPSAGSVSIDGVPVRAPSPRYVVMFQQPSLFPWLSVRRNVALGLEFLGRESARERDRKVAGFLELVELSELADRNVQNLSGGQQQRVALARSLAVEPAVLMLDEPFSALDTFTRTSLQQDVRAITRRLGTTLVIVTHDVGEAALMADRCLVMTSAPGRIAADLALDLPARRSAQDAAVIAARERIRTAFEAASGLPARRLHPVPDDFVSQGQALRHAL